MIFFLPIIALAIRSPMIGVRVRFRIGIGLSYMLWEPLSM